MEIYVKNKSFYFLFFWFSNMILSDAFILPVSQLQTQQVMTSLIRSQIEYLIQTYHFLVIILYSKLMQNLALMALFKYDLTTIRDSGLLFWATLYMCYAFIFAFCVSDRNNEFHCTDLAVGWRQSTGISV